MQINSSVATLTAYILEDDVEYAKGLLCMFQATNRVSVLGHAMMIADAREFIHGNTADVYLVDVSLPDGSGIEFIPEILGKNFNAKILILSTLGHERHIISALKAGASGYLLKSESSDRIIENIITIANNGGALGGHASKVLINKLNEESPIKKAAIERSALISEEELLMLKGVVGSDIDPSSITRREIEVLKIISKGLATKQVAFDLGISAFTVNQHLRSIFRKLNVRNRMEAVKKANELRLM